MTSVIVQGVFEVEPAERARFLETRLDVIRASRHEEGCLEYVLAADPLEPGRVIISERWESMDHLQRHLDAASHDESARLRIPPLSADITVYEIVTSKRLG